MTAEIIIARAIANGNESQETFSGAPKDGNFNGVPGGSVFIIPDGYKVFANKKFRNAEFCIVNADGSSNAYEFYPSSCGKQFFIVNPDGTKKVDAQGHQEVLMPTGDFAEAYRAATSVEEFMQSMKGKRIELTYPETAKVYVMRYGTADVKEVTIPNFKIVG